MRPPVTLALTSSRCALSPCGLLGRPLGSDTGRRWESSEGLIELTEVVEEPARPAAGPQGRRAGLAIAEVAEQTVADAAPDAPELLLHRLEGVTRARALDLEEHREEGREPADGAGGIDIVEESLAAVGLRDRRATSSRRRSTAEGEQERGEEHVVNLRLVGLGDLVEQCLGLLGVERDVDVARALLDVGGARRVHQLNAGPSRGLGEPVAALAPDLVARGVGVEPLCPLPERGGLGQKDHRLSARELLIRRPEIIEQDAPGYAVHREVVNHEENPARSPLPREKSSTRASGPSSKLRLACAAPAAFSRASRCCSSRHLAEIHRLEGDAALLGLDNPRRNHPAFSTEAQPERVVVRSEPLDQPVR